MSDNSTFKRYEYKYLLTESQKKIILQGMENHMKLDQYGRVNIRNIYFDTDNYRLIRNSLEKPLYKEKLRLRSYKKVNDDSKVFVELKKKYESVVYKRRICALESEVKRCFKLNIPLPDTTQIGREIQYFRMYYEGLKPIIFISYEREAYYALDGSEFRVTFDENILYRQTDISLSSDVYGRPILASGQTLMELKTIGGIPLWMTKILTKQQIYRTSFSKYGTAYMDIKNRFKGDNVNV